jgi:hypothetical protein
MTFSQIHQSDPAAVDRWTRYNPEFSFPEANGLQIFWLVCIVQQTPLHPVLKKLFLPLLMPVLSEP